ncbi:MAG: PD-(D/E)XK nuclease family protein [Chloroflexi bacterium]|nr:PD-(D/E)XK nuclease family protein [Chloroflexota bacterium]
MSDTKTHTGVENRLILGRLSPDLPQALWRLVADAKRHDVLAPVTIVAPTRYAGLSLRQELGREGFVNVRFMMLPMLAELLGGAALERQGRRPLTNVVETMTLRRLLQESTGPLAQVREHPSTLFSLRRVFEQLRNAGEDVRAKLAARDDLSGVVARMHDRFRELVRHDWYDQEDLAEAASEEVLAGEAPGLDDLGLIVFYLPRRTSPAQAKLMDSLAQRGRTAMVLGITGDELADEASRELADRLEAMMGSPEHAGVPDGQMPVLPGSVRLHITPNAHEELRGVIRQLVEEAEVNQTPLHRMAILYRAADPYATLIRDELRLAGIPMAGPDAETLGNTPAGRTLRGALHLSRGGYQRTELMAWLSGCPVRPRGQNAREFNPSQWDAISRKASIVGGLEQWRARLDSHATLLSAEADRREAAGEISAARARGMRAEANSARSLLAFVEALAKHLELPPPGSKWSALAEWAGGLLDKYLAANSDGSDDDALRRIRRMLDEFNTADAMGDTADAHSFREMVEEGLRAPFGHLGPTGLGVFVSSFAGAAGMTFDAVWVVGMVEGSVPPPGVSDPLLPEPHWVAAGGSDRFRQRMSDERNQYFAVANSASRLALSYPHAHAASQRQAYPSRWFLEQASVLEDRAVYTDDLPGLHDREWLTIDSSAAAALRDVAGNSVADEHDYRLHRLLRWRQSDKQLWEHPFAANDPLAAAMRLSRSRVNARLTEFDGNLSSISDDDRFSVGLRRAPISSTGLESWAACPYRYFLGSVLGLRALETPEETVSINALDRGALIHEVLERFIRESVENGLLPRAGDTWGPADHDRLMGIANELFENTEARGATGKRLLWDMDKATIVADLETFLEEDAKSRSDHGTARVEVEAAFGFGGETVEVIDPETGIRFRGLIDRVDVGGDGESILVIDYKTGSARPYAGMEDDVIDGGRHLQLGVYSLAVRALFPGATRIKAAYWFNTNRGGFAFAPSQRFDINDDDTAQRFRDGVTSIVSGINSGVFPTNPGPLDRGTPANCRYCDFDSVCPARRRELWNLKKSDALVSDYLELAGEA